MSICYVVAAHNTHLFATLLVSITPVRRLIFLLLSALPAVNWIASLSDAAQVVPTVADFIHREHQVSYSPSVSTYFLVCSPDNPLDMM